MIKRLHKIDNFIIVLFGRLMRFSYRKLGLTPAAMILLPTFAMLLIGCIGNVTLWLETSIIVHLLPVIGTFSLYFIMYFKNGHYRQLMGEIVADYDAQKFKRYAKVAQFFQSHNFPLRMFMLFMPLMTPHASLLSSDPISAAEIQTEFFWLGMIYFAYISSTEPPKPDDGDTFIVPQSA